MRDIYGKKRGKRKWRVDDKSGKVFFGLWIELCRKRNV